MSSVRRSLAACSLVALLLLTVSWALAPADEPTQLPDDPVASGQEAESSPDAPAGEAETPAASGDKTPASDESEAAADDPSDSAPTDPKPSGSKPADSSDTKPADPQAGDSEAKEPAATDANSAPPEKPKAAKYEPPVDGKYRLEYKFTTGEVIRWEVVHQAVVDTTIQGSSQTAETRSTSVKMWRVTDVSPEGKITLVHSVESIDMWQKMQGRQEVRYNSTSDDAVPPGYEEIAKAVGVPLTVITFDRHGEVLNREEKHPQSNTANMPLAIPLPADRVAVGFIWYVPNDVEVILKDGASRKIQTKQKYKLEKVNDGVATITVETQILKPLNDPAIEAQLVQRLTDGALRFDLEQGRLVSQQLDLDRRVVGFSGASSSMHYVQRFTEELLSAQTPPVAKKKPATPSASVDKPTPGSAQGLKQPASAMGGPPKPINQRPATAEPAATAQPKQPTRR